MTRDAWLTGALVVIGILQMSGDLLDRAGADRLGPAIRGIGAATGASPAPKVFSAVQGLETFSTRFFIEWTGSDGAPHSHELTPELYSRLHGPYPRRNAYGAALAYGPLLATSPRTSGLLDSMLRFALSADAPLLRELGMVAQPRSGPVRIRYVPRTGSMGDLPDTITAE